MKRLLCLGAAVAIVLSAAPPAEAQVLTTAFAVQNMGDVDATIVVEWYDEEGDLVYTSPGVVVGPGALGNFLAGTGLPSSWQGSVVVLSDQPISAIVNTTDNFSTPRYWGSSEGFGSDSVGTSLSLPFVLRNRGGRSSTVGVQNAGSEAANVYISFVGHSSSPTDYQVVKNLNPGAATVLDLEAEVTALGNAWMGSVVVTSTQELAASALDVGTDIMYNYSGVSSPSTDLLMPFVVGDRSNQDTAHALLNPSDTVTASVTVTYTGQIGGSPVQAVVSRTLGPSQMWNSLHSADTGSGFLGSGVVHSDQPVLGIVNHTYGAFSSSGRKMSYTMIDAAAATGRISLPFVLRERSNKAQGIIIQNTSSVTTTLYVSFTPLAGGGNGSPYTHNQQVGPGLFYNFGTSYSDWDSIGDGAYGTMVVTNTAGVDIVSIVNTWNTAVSSSRDSLGSYVGNNY